MYHPQIVLDLKHGPDPSVASWGCHQGRVVVSTAHCRPPLSLMYHTKLKEKEGTCSLEMQGRAQWLAKQWAGRWGVLCLLLETAPLKRASLQYT